VPSPEPLAIDARGAAQGIRPWTRVAGVPLVARHVRQAGRAGVAAVTVVVADAERAVVEQALAERPAPAVEVRFASAPPPGARLVPALALYQGDFAPIAELTSAADVAAAERRLFAALRKTVALDGAVAFYVMRPLARVATRALVGTRVTPNQVTFAALGLGLAAAWAAAGAAWALAGVLIWLAATVDCIDGDLARLRIEGSRRGEWLDSAADELSTFALLVALGVRLGMPLLGVLGASLGTATAAKLYSDLDSMRLPIDTAQYPWFFGKPSDRTPPTRGLARVVYLASFLFQRDAYITVVAVALLAGAPQVAFFCLFGGIAFLTLLLLIHIVVTHASPPRH
jgi:hypothetical protein